MARRNYGKATVVSGVRYRSGFEAAVATALETDSVEFGYEDLTLFYTIPHSHRTDFSFEKKDGGTMVVEAKGYFDAENRRNTLAVIEANPEIDYRMLFQNANKKLTKAAGSMTYAKWCERNKIQWAEGSIPRAWIQECK